MWYRFIFDISLTALKTFQKALMGETSFFTVINFQNYICTVIRRVPYLMLKVFYMSQNMGLFLHLEHQILQLDCGILLCL